MQIIVLRYVVPRKLRYGSCLGCFINYTQLINIRCKGARGRIHYIHLYVEQPRIVYIEDTSSGGYSTGERYYVNKTTLELHVVFCCPSGRIVLYLLT